MNLEKQLQIMDEELKKGPVSAEELKAMRTRLASIPGDMGDRELNAVAGNSSRECMARMQEAMSEEQAPKEENNGPSLGM